MSGKTESAVSVSMSASTRMIITIISVIFVAKRLAITQEEKRLVPKRQSAQLVVRNMEKLRTMTFCIMPLKHQPAQK